MRRLIAVLNSYCTTQDVRVRLAKMHVDRCAALAHNCLIIRYAYAIFQLYRLFEGPPFSVRPLKDRRGSERGPTRFGPPVPDMLSSVVRSTFLRSCAVAHGAVLRPSTIRGLRPLFICRIFSRTSPSSDDSDSDRESCEPSPSLSSSGEACCVVWFRCP